MTTQTTDRALSVSAQAAAQLPAEAGKPSQLASVSLDVQSLSEAVKVAELMSRSKQGVPKPFREEPGLCFAVVCQAMAWRMNPFQVASQAYVVNDQVAYMAQIIKAAIDQHAPLDEPLDIQFQGEGPDRSARVVGHIITRSGRVVERVYESPPLRAIPVKNSPLWKNDPDQQLGYYAARAWARRHCPGVLSGVYDPEELKHGSTVNAPAPARPLAERLAQAAPMRLDFTNGGAAPDDLPARDINEDSETGEDVSADRASLQEGAVENPASQPADPAPSDAAHDDADADMFPGDRPAPRKEG